MHPLDVSMQGLEVALWDLEDKFDLFVFFVHFEQQQLTVAKFDPMGSLGLNAAS